MQQAFMKLKTILVFSFISFSLSGQSYQTVKKVVSLHDEQSFYLNSATRIGGKTKNSIKIDLPKNTVQWFYSFTTSPNESEANPLNKNLKLGLQLTNLLLNSAIESTTIGLTAKAAFQVLKPTGAGVVDIYLTDLEGHNQFIKKDILGFWPNSDPKTYKEGSRENAKDGVVMVDDLKSGSVYLCFKNPSSLEGVFVTIEVSAIVAVEEYVDVWSTVSKQNLSTECLNSFLNKNETAKQICSCRTDKIIKKYTPKAYNAFSQNEKTLILKNEINACYSETENISQNDRIKSIEEEIRGFAVVKDYKKLILKYEELISLGVENDTIYNAIGHYNLLIKNFKKAKEYLTIGLGKNANNLLLQSNLAHYYLFTGEVKNAENIYLKYAKSKITKKTTWKDVIKADFELFESLGFNKSDMDGIREVLRIKN
jgi:hypothetical protein